MGSAISFVHPEIEDRDDLCLNDIVLVLGDPIRILSVLNGSVNKVIFPVNISESNVGYIGDLLQSVCNKYFRSCLLLFYYILYLGLEQS